jgi:hypothetical protein
VIGSAISAALVEVVVVIASAAVVSAVGDGGEREVTTPV